MTGPNPTDRGDKIRTKRHLCLDKGYDFQEIEHESIKRYYIPHIYLREKKIVA